MLDAARHMEDAPKLAWLLLLLSGIGVTLAANITFGVAFGLLRRTVGSVASARFRRLLRDADGAGQSVGEVFFKYRL